MNWLPFVSTVVEFAGQSIPQHLGEFVRGLFGTPSPGVSHSISDVATGVSIIQKMQAAFDNNDTHVALTDDEHAFLANTLNLTKFNSISPGLLTFINAVLNPLKTEPTAPVPVADMVGTLVATAAQVAEVAAQAAAPGVAPLAIDAAEIAMPLAINVGTQIVGDLQK